MIRYIVQEVVSMKSNSSNKLGRTVTLSAAVLLAATMLSACGSNAATTPDPNYQDTTVNQGTPDQSQSPVSNSDTGGGATDNSATNDAINSPTNSSSPDESTNTNPDGTAQDITHEGEGTFTGQADSHSVEITTSKGATVYQIDDITAESIKDIGQDDKVKFQYKEQEIDTNDGKITQLWLTKIEKA
jgi:outer membrane protein assembly factor BamE (lipoprotein component of BamABCDE complex)